MITARPAAASSQRKAGLPPADYGRLCRGIFKVYGNDACRSVVSSGITRPIRIPLRVTGATAPRCRAAKSDWRIAARCGVRNPAVATLATVAQWIEHRISNSVVTGSSPVGCAIHKFHSAFFSLRANRKKVAA